MSEPVIIVAGLGKCYLIDKSAKKTSGEYFNRVIDFLLQRASAKSNGSVHWALRDVSFTVNRGDRIGIIGRNGAGKSTLLKILSRVSYPTTGEARIRGSLTSLLEVGTGFNDNLSGRENIFLNASLYGMTRADIANKFDDIVTFSEVGRFIDTPVKHYSSGMRMRLAFSVAAHLEPDILLLDEVLAVGDMSFQRKCLERVDALTSNGQTLFFVSHSMDSIKRYCNRCIWLDGGIIREDGNVDNVISAYVENVLKVKSSHSEPVAGISKVGALAEAKIDLNQRNIDKKYDSINNTLTQGNGIKADLISAHIIDKQFNPINSISVTEQVGVRFNYRIYKSGHFVPSIALYSPGGGLIFWSVPTVQEINKYFLEIGDFESIVWIPPDILNIGLYRITVALIDPSESPMIRHFNHDKLLSFHTLGSNNLVGSSSGILPRPFPGALRPILEWELNRPFEVPDFIVRKRLDVSIDTSGFCNARCENCVWPFMSRSESMMTIDNFKAILGRFHGYEFGEFAFNSINEPFADKNILEKLEHFIDSEIKTNMLFISSNWLIPKNETIDKFVAIISKALNGQHIRKVSINATISGIDELSYDELQAGKSLENSTFKYKALDFSRASKNVVALVQRLRNVVDLNKNFIIHIKAYGSLFSAEQYQSHWRNELINAGIEEDFIKRKVKILLNHSFTSFARSDKNLIDSGTKKCQMKWLSDRIVIGPDGAVGLCCHEGARKFNLGNLIESSLIKIVSDPKYLAQFALVTGKNSAPNDHFCQNCEFYNSSEGIK